MLILWPARSKPCKQFGDEQAINIEEYLGGLYGYIIYDQLPSIVVVFKQSWGLALVLLLDVLYCDLHKLGSNRPVIQDWKVMP